MAGKLRLWLGGDAMNEISFSKILALYFLLFYVKSLSVRFELELDDVVFVGRLTSKMITYIHIYNMKNNSTAG